MGEVADSILEGEFDCETGEYIGKPVGYPRTLNNNTRRHKQNSNLTNETKIVWNYMEQKGIIGPFNTEKSTLTKLYGKEKSLGDKTSVICASIRKNEESWKEFKKWFANKLTETP